MIFLLLIQPDNPFKQKAISVAFLHVIHVNIGLRSCMKAFRETNKILPFLDFTTYIIIVLKQNSHFEMIRITDKEKYM
jgi:hypothetical protein